MRSSASTESRPASAVPTWQSLRAFARALLAIAIVAVTLQSIEAEIFDSLDSHPPRWYLASSDCEARVVSQGHLVDGGVAGGACETITLTASHGTEALLVYPIEPVRPLDDLTASVSVMSAKEGARIGFRVRYPYVRDPETRSPVSVVVYGATYETAGEFASIGIGMIQRELRMRNIAVRQEFGSDADLSDPYVDGVVINAYTGAGTTALRMDQLRIRGLVPLGQDLALGYRRQTNDASNSSEAIRAARVDDAGELNESGVSPRPAFPVGTVTKILQHNGEPLSWVRSLGFDAVLLSKPPDAEILREAIRARVNIYAPPPSAPDPALESLLEPVQAWYLGLGEAMDSRGVEQAALTSQRLRSWPARWSRPLVGAPSEAWQRYAPWLDAIIDDLPPRERGIGGGEEVAQMMEKKLRLGEHTEAGVGIVSMPAEPMLQQTEAIADAIGAARPQGFQWHAMWLQALRSLESTPRAILFRSTRSLSGGTGPLAGGAAMQSQRSAALSYVNRMIAMIAPWVASSTPATAPSLQGAPYRCTRLSADETDLLLITSVATRGSAVLAGDGRTLEILLDPYEASKTAWRLTHFSAERITPQTTESGARLSIVSPDAAELIVLSSDPSEGGRLAAAAERFARQAALDRWQLATELVERTADDWSLATAMRVADQTQPSNLVGVARRTLQQTEPLYRAGDIGSTLRMARRADAWAIRSRWQLAETLMPDWPTPTSCPPVEIDDLAVQSAWQSLMQPQGWGKDRLVFGHFDTPDTVQENRWSFGRRLAESAKSEVMHVRRGSYEGGGALRIRVAPSADDGLPGGYEGTVIQVRSPTVRVAAGKAIRIDAMVRTIGFGNPHQGVLVYDNLGGQEAGVLLRGRSAWTPVRLYRQTIGETPVQVMFEVIGGGEVTIDQVTVRVWEPEQQGERLYQPIAENGNDESTKR